MAMIPWRAKLKSEAVREGSPLAFLRQEMDRVFDSFRRDPWGALEWPFRGEAAWGPTVDVVESEQEVTVRAEVPGIDPKDLDISMTGNQLVLAGEKKECSETKDQHVYQCETRYGSFRRAIVLPDSVDASKVDASYANGVLTIRLAKTPTAPVKRIEVKVC